MTLRRIKYFLRGGQPLVPQSNAQFCPVSVELPPQVPPPASTTILTRALCFEPPTPQVFEHGPHVLHPPH